MIDIIGSTLGSESNSLSQTTLDQEDFLRLFLTELNFQDPLEPLDNREFLAQIAEYSSLEQSRQTTESLSDLTFLNATSQSVGLLGQQVQLNNDGILVSGIVSSVQFTESGPVLDVTESNGNILRQVQMSQVSRVIDL